jgi:hypothetical protein
VSEIPVGLSLSEVNGAFVLRRKDAGGSISSICLSGEEILSLQETLAFWKDRLTSSSLTKSGQVQEVRSRPVASVGLAHEMLGEHLLLTLVAPSGARNTYSLRAHSVETLVENLPNFLDDLRSPRRTKQ